MELTPRKREILAEIVRAHIETGEPIGSKILSQRMNNPPSTATLRNEMSDLCEMGYLCQPHTSAGRLPTSKAYRLYVSELMKKEDLSEEGKKVLDKMLSDISLDPENIGTSAAKILCELTGLPVLVAANNDRTVRVKKISLLPMGRNSAVVFLITDDGRAKSRIVCLERPLSPAAKESFEKIAVERLCERPTTELTQAYLQSVTVLAGINALEVAPLLSCLFDLASELRTGEVKMVGEANLFSVFQKEIEAKRLLELLSGSETVNGILKKMTDPVGVIFGDDTAYSELKSAGMIVATYGDEQNYGKIAVIGPTRMSYGRLLPSVEYLADRMGNIMSEVLKGLEE